MAYMVMARLYLEEVFDCGEHAVGATHTYDGTNGGEHAIAWAYAHEYVIMTHDEYVVMTLLL